MRCQIDLQREVAPNHYAAHRPPASHARRPKKLFTVGMKRALTSARQRARPEEMHPAVVSAGDGQDVQLSDHPCVKERCSEKPDGLVTPVDYPRLG